MTEIYPEEVELLFSAIGKRRGREHKERLRELSQTALLPHMKDEDRREFLSSLADKESLIHNLSEEEQRRENEKAKNFFKKY